MTTPKPEPNKVSITIRLRPSTVETYRRSGRGWQTRLSSDLDRIADRIVHVADGSVRSYEGGWSANASVLSDD
jgi:hypothetical protein